MLISDVVMPEMSGDAVANQLRARWPELLVVFLKPVAPSELDATIRAALDG